MDRRAVENAIARNNFRTAREMLCIKMGWTKEFSHYIMRHDVDASWPEREKFIKKVTRILAYNYDVHRCPNPAMFPALWPNSKPGSQPVRLPPEFRENQTTKQEESKNEQADQRHEAD